MFGRSLKTHDAVQVSRDQTHCACFKIPGGQQRKRNEWGKSQVFALRYVIYDRGIRNGKVPVNRLVKDDYREQDARTQSASPILKPKIQTAAGLLPSTCNGALEKPCD